MPSATLVYLQLYVQWVQNSMESLIHNLLKDSYSLNTCFKSSNL